MSALTIRRLDDRVKARLRVRAAQHGRSMEEEARQILQFALAQEAVASSNIAESIQKRFAGLGPLEIPDLRSEPVPPPRFGK